MCAGATFSALNVMQLFIFILYCYLGCLLLFVGCDVLFPKRDRADVGLVHVPTISIKHSFGPFLFADALIINLPTALSGTNISSTGYHSFSFAPAARGRARQGVVKSISGSALCAIFSSLYLSRISEFSFYNQDAAFSGVILLVRQTGDDTCQSVVKALAADILGAEGILIWMEEGENGYELRNKYPSVVPDIPVEFITRSNYEFLSHFVDKLGVEIVGTMSTSADTSRFF